MNIVVVLVMLMLFAVVRWRHAVLHRKQAGTLEQIDDRLRRRLNREEIR
ncbi:hypothetical protein [Paenibacillus ginsengihumi]|nr:hypothetical protein [Paenibacillus ginsengihumi]